LKSVNQHPAAGANSLDVRWYALAVRSNAEKAVVLSLQQRALRTFLPMYRVRRRWSDRTKELDVPLFPGYVFSRFRCEQRLAVMKVMGVVSIVGLGKRPEPIPDEEIGAIEALVRSGSSVEPQPYLAVGERVRIVAGPLASVEGILLQEKSRCRIVVSIHILQRYVAATIERSLVEPVAIEKHRMFITNFGITS
jgi:transcriptional antiterminator NusG